MNRSLSLRVLRPAFRTVPTPPSALSRPSALVRFSPLSPLSLQSKTPATRSLAPSLFATTRAYATSSKGDKDKDKGTGGKDAGQKSGDTAAKSDKPAFVDQQNLTSRAMDEIRGVTHDIAEIIAGGSSRSVGGGTAPAAKSLPGQLAAMESSSHSHGGSVREDFITITTSMITEVPKPALYFGLAGTLPYLGTSVGTVLLAREASRASQGLSTMTGMDLPSALAQLHTLEHIQITYGAIILSFLGAIHWGMEFSKLGGEQGYRRLVIGTLPVLFAWPTTFLSHGVALATQWLGFTGMWFLDQRASNNGWTTNWYSTYRFYLSIIVGFSIIGTLAGTGYYGAGAGAVTDPRAKHLRHTTERQSAYKSIETRVAKKNFPDNDSTRVGRVEGKVGGDIEVESNEGGESYTKFHNVAKDEEEKQQQEEEKQKQAEKQDKKDEHQMDKAPGTMKNQAEDRTGKNANMPGGEEEKEGGGEEGKGGKGRLGKKEQTAGEKDPGTKRSEEKDVPEQKKGDSEKAQAGKGEKAGDGSGSESKNEGGDAGKSQQKKDNPDGKGAAGEKNTGKR